MWLAYREAHTGVADPRLRSPHYPTPTTEESQAWLAANPEQAAKAVGYEPVTFIPFGPERTVKMMIAEMEGQDMAHTRGTVGAKSEYNPAGAKREDPVIETRIIGVGWAWNDA